MQQLPSAGNKRKANQPFDATLSCPHYIKLNKPYHPLPIGKTGLTIGVTTNIQPLPKRRAAQPVATLPESACQPYVNKDPIQFYKTQTRLLPLPLLSTFLPSLKTCFQAIIRGRLNLKILPFRLRLGSRRISLSSLLLLLSFT